MPARVFCIAFLLFTTCISAQADSVQSAPGPVPGDAVYLTYEDFRHSRPVRKEELVSQYDKEQLDFLNRALQEETFEFERDGIRQKVRSEGVFGFVQNSTLYLNYNARFYRVPVFGAISYFVASVVVRNTFYDPRFGYPSGTTTTTELREFVMNFYDGKTEDLTVQKAEELLSHDPVLYAAFRKLRRRRQREEMYRYIRLYNERHPVYFLKS